MLKWLCNIWADPPTWAMPLGRRRLGDAVWAPAHLGDGPLGRPVTWAMPFGRRATWATGHLGDAVWATGHLGDAVWAMGHFSDTPVRLWNILNKENSVLSILLEENYWRLFHWWLEDIQLHKQEDPPPLLIKLSFTLQTSDFAVSHNYVIFWLISKRSHNYIKLSKLKY